MINGRTRVYGAGFVPSSNEKKSRAENGMLSSVQVKCSGKQKYPIY